MLTIYGASDDLVELEGIHNDELSPGDKGVTLVIGNPEAGPGRDAEGCVVRINYGEDMCWRKEGSFAVWGAMIAQIDEDTDIPWPIKIDAEEYSVRVSIDCPEGTPVEAWVDGKVVWRDGKHLNEEE